jgi:hypothetical protein
VKALATCNIKGGRQDRRRRQPLSLVEQMAVRRAPLPVFAPRSEVSRRYEELWAEVRRR